MLELEELVQSTCDNTLDVSQLVSHSSCDSHFQNPFFVTQMRHIAADLIHPGICKLSSVQESALSCTDGLFLW